MRIRRVLPALIATAALAGLGLTGAASATAPAQGAATYVTPSQCKQGGGMADLADNLCKGGMHNGETID
ncbi:MULTISPECIES: hypothetical protein [unclassified Streptomyces]|uniref:hypothetical protein n=1 Tax=unclassified Streptomyces TaxID=2593676 RepID=UPI002DDB30D2|nr:MULTISPECIES: hypothetical protein [unclassified Streptomyces]WSD97509.1 hypothetical protein OG758_27175 [Streptomyces sp. NBC_01474]